MADITIDQTSTTSDYVIGRLTNYNNAAEGSGVPPRQQGQSRVPYVDGVKVVQSVASLAGTQFTLSWNNVTSANISVDHYNIYYTLALTNSTQPVGPFIAMQSPAQITVPNTTSTGVTFTVQTVLSNGMTSGLAESPTTAAFVNTPKVQESNLGFSLLSGLQMQPLATVTGIVWPAPGFGSGPFTTNILTTTGAAPLVGGGLISVGIRQSVLRNMSPIAPDVEPQVAIQVQVDSQTPETLIVYDVGGPKWNLASESIANDVSTDGNVAGAFIMFNMNLAFQSSLIVNLVLSSGINNNVDLTGRYDVSVLYCTKTS
jgi:hypothetical protein